MPIFHDLLLSAHRYFRFERELRFRADERIANFAAPLIDKLLANDEDGSIYRRAIAHWHLAERPPLALYRGRLSRCRIDGPLHDAPDDYPDGDRLPLGGLINTPGVTAHLSPFEADALQHRIQEAIEREIVGWAEEHRLYDLPRGPDEIDRPSADRAAKAQIANWKPESRRMVFVAQATSDDLDHV